MPCTPPSVHSARPRPLARAHRGTKIPYASAGAPPHATPTQGMHDPPPPPARPPALPGPHGSAVDLVDARQPAARAAGALHQGRYCVSGCRLCGRTVPRAAVPPLRPALRATPRLLVCGAGGCLGRSPAAAVVCRGMKRRPPAPGGARDRHACCGHTRARAPHPHPQAAWHPGPHQRVRLGAQVSRPPTGQGARQPVVGHTPTVRVPQHCH